MRLCPISEIETGMIVGKSIYHSNGNLVLAAGYRFTPPIKAKLESRGYSHVYIMEDGTEDIVPEDIISDEVKCQAKMKLADKMKEIHFRKEFINANRDKAVKLINEGYLKDINITYEMRKIVAEILKDISSAGAKLINTVMIKSSNEYFLDHALNVTVLSIFIARKYRFSRKEIASLALGAFLHDIGKVVINQMVGEDKSNDESNELYAEHPTFGYLMLHESPNVTPLESQVVNQHHEYQDGSGFPIGLKGSNQPPINIPGCETKGHIFRFAEICCVANAFDKLNYNPLSKEMKTPDQAMKSLIINSGTLYNKDIVETLAQVLPFYPVGATVKVVNIIDPSLIGCRGVVARIHKDKINRPVIILTRNKFLKKINPITIDTSEHQSVKLKLII